MCIIYQRPDELAKDGQSYSGVRRRLFSDFSNCTGFSLKYRQRHGPASKPASVFTADKRRVSPRSHNRPLFLFPRDSNSSIAYKFSPPPVLRPNTCLFLQMTERLFSLSFQFRFVPVEFGIHFLSFLFFSFFFYHQQ